MPVSRPARRYGANSRYSLFEVGTGDDPRSRSYRDAMREFGSGYAVQNTGARRSGSGLTFYRGEINDSVNISMLPNNTEQGYSRRVLGRANQLFEQYQSPQMPDPTSQEAAAEYTAAGNRQVETIQRKRGRRSNILSAPLSRQTSATLRRPTLQGSSRRRSILSSYSDSNGSASLGRRTLLGG